MLGKDLTLEQRSIRIELPEVLLLDEPAPHARSERDDGIRTAQQSAIDTIEKPVDGIVPEVVEQYGHFGKDVLAEEHEARVETPGGGARNPTLLRAIAEQANGEVVTADSLGWDGDALEAQAFAFLAVRSLRGLPISFPGTTGVSRPLTGGRLHRP